MDHVFWNNYPKDSLVNPEDAGKSGSRMFQSGALIIYEFSDYDREDHHRTDHSFRFPVEDYRRALAELKQTGRAELSGEGTMKMIMTDEGIELKLCGYAFSVTDFYHRIEDLALP